MILTPLLDALRALRPPPADAPLTALSPVLRAVADHLVSPAPVDVPFGRYLLHEDPAFNVQLDVFSPRYVGGIHRHGTWGVFGVLRGRLDAEDFDADGRAPLRLSAVPPGGAMAFARGHDWHRVGTGECPQVVSVHVYGPGFDLVTGEALSPDGSVRRYTRSAFGDRAALRSLLGG